MEYLRRVNLQLFTEYFRQRSLPSFQPVGNAENDHFLSPNPLEVSKMIVGSIPKPQEMIKTIVGCIFYPLVVMPTIIFIPS